MKTRVIQIGRSHGVRIPKALLEQTGLCGEVEVAVVHNAVVIRSAKKRKDEGAKPRAGWAAEFGRMRKNGDDDVWADAPVSLSIGDD